MKNKSVFILILLLTLICLSSGRKLSGSRSSSRSSSGKRTQPVPTSYSYSQQSAPKPTLFGWQEKSAQKSQTFSSWQSKPSSGQGHSYPSSQSGLSGSGWQQKQPTSNQESFQKSGSSIQQAPPRPASPQQMNNQPSHSYPSSNGLSGNPGISHNSQSSHGQQSTGSGYPNQGSGLSGSGNGYPQQHGSNGYPHNSGAPVSGSSYPQQNSGVGYPQGSGISGNGAPPPYSGYKTGDNRQYNAGGYNNYGNQYNHPQGPPPPYFASNHGGYGGHPPYNPGYVSQMPGYFGNYGNNGKGFGGVSRSGSALKGIGIAGAGIGTVLTGLALWNLARSTGNHQHTVIYDNRGQPVAVAPVNNTAPAVDSMLADLVNCTLTISTDNATEVLGIPCAIATSFAPDANIQESGANNNPNDTTKCTVTVVTKTGKEYMTTIPCSTLLNTAAENNVTEPPLNATESLNNENGTAANNDHPPSALKLTGEATGQPEISLNCTPVPENIRDPINPCFAVTHNLTVIPLPSTIPTDVEKKES